jgi:GTP-binding protein Era
MLCCHSLSGWRRSAIFTRSFRSARVPGETSSGCAQCCARRFQSFFAAELLRGRLFTTLGQELPYRCEAVIDSFKEEGALRRIEATILVERDSQKGIVVGAGGAQLKKIASGARRDMERLFGGKVYLGVWVKVRKGWTDDERVLRQLGHA